MGQVVQSPQQQQTLEDQGWLKCRTPTCNYMLSPEEVSDMEDRNHFFSCPSCKVTYPLLDPTPFHMQGGGITGNPNPQGQEPVEGINRNWETIVGLSMRDQGKLAEDVVREMKTIPGYGPITWWSENYNDPIDGGAGEWGIEVKAICIDAKNHRFVPGSTKRKDDMIARATELGFKGILGTLVILDYRRSVADVYTMEMPLDPWVTKGNRPVQGPVAFRKHNGEHLVAEIPFNNPFLNPRSPEPQTFAHTGDDIPF